jgi:hypothetical protein
MNRLKVIFSRKPISKINHIFSSLNIQHYLLTFPNARIIDYITDGSDQPEAKIVNKVKFQLGAEH